MTSPAKSPLRRFEVPRSFIMPAVAALRLGNTALDTLFYDVGVLATELFWRGSLAEADSGSPPAASSGPISGFHEVWRGALSNPEGSILVVDAAKPPYVTRRFDDVRDFFRAAKSAASPLRTLSVTGVGSSALGSVACAWNISTALCGKRKRSTSRTSSLCAPRSSLSAQPECQKKSSVSAAG